ncbi:MAG TPA: fumarylacetoacetate hydrolase family protein [Magnetospirillaceae bacterium]|jgi:2-oxo-3-hexenedioate decarboxylase
MTDFVQLAETVDEAARTASAVPQLTLTNELSPDEGYAIQALAFQRRLARGEKQVGIKMGLTSRAKMIQVNVDEVIWGQLTDAMRVEDGGTINLKSYVHPRVEPEVAFLLKRPLSGAISPAEAVTAIAAVAPAMEIIDSRYENFKFTLPDVVADNASSSGFVIGAWNDPIADLSNRGMIMEFDGRPVQIGSTAAILGDPLRSLVAAARMVGKAGFRLEAGWVVMAGAATAAQPLVPGIHVRNSVEGLGHVAFSVAG